MDVAALGTAARTAARTAVDDAAASLPTSATHATSRMGLTDDPRWYQKATIYQAHVRSFMDANGDGIGDFQGLTQQLHHVEDLGADAIWLLPFTKSPLRDGGYDVSDFTAINPIYGTMGDFEQFVDEAHSRGIRVITELVLNHSSDQHPWFQRAIRAPRDSPERNFYVWEYTDGPHDPPTRFPKDEVRVIFQDFEESNWTWNEEAQGWYWHRFYHHQPDLNWDNPAVEHAMTDVLDFWLDKGVDGLRLDAVPYLFERSGRGGENLVETHEALKRIRRHIEDRYPGETRIILPEANMPAKETLEYFGDGDEAHLAYNFPLMPRLYMGTAMGDKNLVIEGFEQTGRIPEGTSWATFLRNHDEMTLEKVTDNQREWMWNYYAQGDEAAGIDGDPRSRINLGIRRRLGPMMGMDPRRIEMMNSMLFSSPGSPIVYYGDEIGMGDHLPYVNELVDRDGVRTPMQWSDAVNGGFSTAPREDIYPQPISDAVRSQQLAAGELEGPAATSQARWGFENINVASQRGDADSMLERTKELIAVRKKHPALMQGDWSNVPTDAKDVVAYARTSDDEQVLAVVNLSGEARTVKLDTSDLRDGPASHIHGSESLDVDGAVPTEVALDPYSYHWIGIGS